MTKVSGNITQLGVSGMITQKNVSGSIIQSGFIGIAPILQSAVVENAAPADVILTYDLALDEASIPAKTDFALEDKTISSIVISDTTVTITVSVAYEYGDTITISYTRGATPLQAADGADAANLTDEIVTNNIETLPELDFWVKSRSGVELVDDFGNNGKILLPFTATGTSNNSYCKNNDDNKFLDIGAAASTDFTLCGWVKTTSTLKNLRRGLFGKVANNGSVYGFTAEPTTGYIAATIATSTGSKQIISTIDFTSGNWYFLRLLYDRTAHTLSFWINENLIDTIACGGTLTDYGNTYHFYVCGIRTNAGVDTCYLQVSASDVYIYDKALTPTEGAMLMARSIVSGARCHWTMTEYGGNELINNTSDYNLTYVRTTNKDLYIDYSEYGSRQGLDIGYSIYKKLGAKDIHIPYSDAGSPLASPSVPAGYTNYDDILTDSIHNLYNSKIRFVGNLWDRSNATIYNRLARLAQYPYALTYDDEMTYYVSTTPKDWHISELNQQTIYNYKHKGYYGTTYVKFDSDSVLNRTALREILCAPSAEDSALSTVTKYTGDYDYLFSHSVSYIYTTPSGSENIVAKRGNKYLKANHVDTIYLSLDGGITYPYSQGFLICQFAWIFENGNILIANNTKIYLSTDNLTSLNEITPTDIDGNPFTPTGSYTQYFPFSYGQYLVPDTKELLWGNYENSGGQKHLWCTTDQGVHVKEVFRFNTSMIEGNVINASHVHSCVVNPNDGSWIIATGDGAGNAHLIKGVYAEGTWTFTLLIDGSDAYIEGVYYDGYFYFAGDSPYGIYRVAATDITDITKYERIFITGYAITTLKMDSNGRFIANFGDNGLVISSIDRQVFRVTDVPESQQTPGLWKGLIIAWPFDEEGWIRSHLYEDAENLYNYMKGKQFLFKINI